MTQARVRFTPTAQSDLGRLLGYLVGQAQSDEDLLRALEVIDRLEEEVLHRLAVAPFVYRKATDSPFIRELIVPVGGTGYVVLYEIESDALITVLAVRHQREDDFH